MVLLSPIFFLFYIFTDFLFSNSRSPEWDMNGNLSSQPQQRLYVFLFSCLTSCFTYCEICCSVHRMAMSSLWIVLCLVAQSCPTLCYSMDYVACQAPLSMGILQARILEWFAMPSSRGSSQPKTHRCLLKSVDRSFEKWDICRVSMSLQKRFINYKEINGNFALKNRRWHHLDQG